MSNCTFQKIDARRVRCTVCGQSFPALPNWQTIRRNCRGSQAKAGAMIREEKLQRAADAALNIPIGRPGSALKQILTSIGISPKGNCDCNKRMAQMDEWGVAGCKHNRDTIIEWLREGQSRWSWTDKVKAAAAAVRTGLAFKLNPLDPFPGLVDAAIKQAEDQTEFLKRESQLEFTGPVTRNLIMFIYPRRGQEWQRNIEQISRRIELFNGKRIFAVATDHTTVPFQQVCDEIEHFEPTVAEFGNDIGEVVAFDYLWRQVQSRDPNEITFYCHAKGVTKEHSPEIAQIRRWTDAMYEVLLDGVDDVERALVDHIFAGAFRAVGMQFGKSLTQSYAWHYPGTFFWFRNQSLFSQPNWSVLQRKYYGVEAWPGTVVPAVKAACLLADRIPMSSLYRSDDWAKKWGPIMDQWRAKRVQVPQ